MTLLLNGTPEEVAALIKSLARDVLSCQCARNDDDKTSMGVPPPTKPVSEDTKARTEPMFYETFLELCAARGESPSGVAKKIGLSNAAASGWKSGKIPSQTTILKLTNHFKVSSDFFSHPAQWTGDIISKMHVNCITARELAEEAGIDYRYLSMILNGHRTPKNAESRCKEALARLIAKQQKDSTERRKE